ncbi:MAG: S9 family peptidase, partial [Vicinamibacteraceae bacterium]
MKTMLSQWIAGLSASLVIGVLNAGAQATTADYERALGLRERWQYLTENVADPATWMGDTHRFYYRKTVKGGFEFVMVDAETRQKQPAFDHARLAAGLSKATGERHAALRLPFNTFRVGDQERTIEVRVDDTTWSCRIADYVCREIDPRGGRQPRGFGVVRDLEAPADNSPKRSPDGKWEAFVENFNLAVRPRGGQ